MTELIESVCPVCGIVYGLEKTFYDYRRNGSTKEGWYCPNGHSLSIIKSTADKLREQLDEEVRRRQRIEQDNAYQRDRAREAEELAKRERNRANGYKGHATRITKRAKAGVCPCCNRTFQQLARHMATQHPQFTPMPPELEVIDGGKAVA